MASNDVKTCIHNVYRRCKKACFNGTLYCKDHIPTPSMVNICRDSVMCHLVIRDLKFIIGDIKHMKVIGRYENLKFGECLELRPEDKKLCKILKLNV
jgi:hypothetical protein